MNISHIRTIHLTFIAIALLFNPVQAENLWVPSILPIGSYHSVVNIGAENVWVSTGSQVSHSSDGGMTWDEPVDMGVYGMKVLEFADENVGYAAGNSGVILKTTDGGMTWLSQNSGTDRSILDIEVVNSETAWAVGYNGTVLKTSNGGTTWTALSVPTEYDYTSVTAIDTDNAWVLPVESPMLLFRTDNGGDSWSQITPTESIWGAEAIYFSDSQHGWAMTGADIYQTNNGGQSWSQILDSSGLESMEVVNQDVIWVARSPGSMYNNGTVLRTIDGGQNWSIQSIFNSGDGIYEYRFNQICAYDSTSAWVGTNRRLHAFAQRPSLEVTYPAGGEALGIGTQEILRWEQTSMPYVDLFYSTDDGNNWVLIEDTLLASDEMFFWDVPDIPTTTARIKVMGSHVYFDAIEDQSDTPFTIALKPVQFEDVSLYSNISPNALNVHNAIDYQLPLRFKVDVRNNLNENLLTASGVLHSSSPFISITDSLATFNNILTGQSSTSADEFEIYILPGAPTDFMVVFELIVSDEIVVGGPWTTTFNLPLILSPFQTDLIIIDDDNNPDSQGDNDDIAEPGEVIEIIPLLTNTSENEFDELEGELNTIADYISIWDGETGASGPVYSIYPYNVIGGSPETVTAGQTNIMPEQDFVFSYTAAEPYSIPFYLLVSAEVPKYNGMEMRWLIPFELNASQPVNLVVNITAPAAASQFDVGEVISIQADAAGVYGVQRVEFTHGETPLSIDVEAPFEAELNTSDLQPGSYTITAEVWDSAGHSATDVIEYTLVSPTGLAQTGLPKEFRVSNYPNPFNPSTTICYGLPEAGHVLMTVYDVTGREVINLVNTSQPAGYHEAIWNGRDGQNRLVGTGVYFAQITAGDNAHVIKMIYLR